jgi:type IV pilus assembly protein PilA
MNNNKIARKGFTLVEIMIVVVIIGLLAAMAIPAFSKVRAQSRQKAVVNNLRQIATAASQYMLDKGVTQAQYTDLVGTDTDNYIRSVSPVAGEDYTSEVVVQTQTQVSITAVSFGTVTYNM